MSIVQEELIKIKRSILNNFNYKVGTLEEEIIDKEGILYAFVQRFNLKKSDYNIKKSIVYSAFNSSEKKIGIKRRFLQELASKIQLAFFTNLDRWKSRENIQEKDFFSLQGESIRSMGKPIVEISVYLFSTNNYINYNRYPVSESQKNFIANAVIKELSTPIKKYSEIKDTSLQNDITEVRGLLKTLNISLSNDSDTKPLQPKSFKVVILAEIYQYV